MAEQKRDQSLDVVRALAITMVLVIHAASEGLMLTPGTADWWAALAWGAAARPAVPLFFMCTGALMLDRAPDPRRLFTHNMPRILCALFTWALVYHLYSLAKAGAPDPAGLWQAVKKALMFQHEFHFYFLHILLLVYACLPIVGVFVRAASQRELAYALAVWAVTGSLFPWLQNFRPFTYVSPISALWALPMSWSALGCTLLGCCLRRYGRGFSPGLYAGAAALGLLITFGGTAVYSLRGGALDERFLGGMYPGPMLMALGCFGLSLSRKTPRPALWAALTGRLARASFCIYLSHILFLRLFQDHGLRPSASPTALSIPLTALLLLACGWLLWEVLHRVPFVKSYLV